MIHFRNIALLTLCTLFFSFIPKWASGLHFNQILLSDAEFYAQGMRQLYRESTHVSEKNDGTLPIDAKPWGEIIVSRNLGGIAENLHWDLLSLSVHISQVLLVAFILSLYYLCFLTTARADWSLLIAGVSIIPIHVLGGTTFGFQALGFCARDLALFLSIWILVLYIRSLQTNNDRLRIAAYFFCGLCANYYSISFVHLAAVLGLTDLFRTRRIGLLALCTAAWFLAAIPAILDIFQKVGTWAPVDLEIAKIRAGYLIPDLSLNTFSTYLRRFIIHSALFVAGIWAVKRYGSQELNRRLSPWVAIGISSFAIAILGLFIDAYTTLFAIFIPRTSLFLTLAAMLFTVAGLSVWLEHKAVRHASPLALAIAFGLFLFQSNLPSNYRYFRGLYVNREYNHRFFAAVDAVKQFTPPQAVFIAPCLEVPDIAASLRTYADREIYTSFKDGGVAIVDGQRGRIWLQRYQKNMAALDSADSNKLADFMHQEKVGYAFLTEEIAQKFSENPRIATVAKPDGFRILRLVP